MDVLAALHVPTRVQVRAVAQGGVSPRKYEPLEVQLVTCKRPLMCPAGSVSPRQDMNAEPSPEVSKLKLNYMTGILLGLLFGLLWVG